MSISSQLRSTDARPQDEEMAAALDAALDALQRGLALDRDALLRRFPKIEPTIFSTDGLTLNSASQEVRRNKKEIRSGFKTDVESAFRRT